MTTLEIARGYLAAGLSIIPIRADGSKAPSVKWQEHQARHASQGEALRWWGTGSLGIAIICGQVSGHLEVLDFDHPETYQGWAECVRGEDRQLWDALAVVRTPAGGAHVYYRLCQRPAGNTKLARHEGSETLIETRGEGGYVLAPGCPPACHPSGGLYGWAGEHDERSIPVLTTEDHDLLWSLARAFDHMPPEVETVDRAAAGLKPGEDFDLHGPDWAEILVPHGWVQVETRGAERRWRRPGKDAGWSATTGKCRGKQGEDLLRVFSSNARPFEPGRAYGKFRAIALLQHGGDLAAAARTLRSCGYGGGTPPKKPGNGNGNGHGEREPPVFAEPIPASQLRPGEGHPWLLHGYLAPGAITLLSALWKAGKTTLLSHLLVALEEGGEFCGRECSPARVLFVTEESEARWARRRDLLGIHDHVSFLVRPFRGRPDWDTWRFFADHVTGLVGRLRVDLVVFDPLVNLWPVRDENDNSQVLEALLPLHAVAQKPALLLAHHTRKGDGEEATASRGAGSLTGFVDTIIELRRHDRHDRHDRRRVLSAFGRDDETPEELVIELTESGYVSQGTRHEVSIHDLLPVIAGILPLAAPGLTRQEIYGRWPADAGKPNTNRLLAALHHGAEQGIWTQLGDGRRGSPWTFFRPS